MSYIHDKYVVIAADKTSNNIVFMSKLHWIYCLIKEEDILNSLDNPLYTSTTLTKAEILCNHISENPYIEEEQTTQWPKQKHKRTINDLQSIHIKLKIE